MLPFGAAKNVFCVLLVNKSAKLPEPPIASIVVADPPDPPVPIPINSFLLPSANDN